MSIVNVLTEAVVVGVVLVIIGGCVMELLRHTSLKVNCSNNSKCDYNKYHIREVALFLTGVLTHLLFEILSGNKWYCKHGNACVNLRSRSK
jgi:hypothetical protein